MTTVHNEQIAGLLQGDVAVVTGSSRGIGRAIAIAMAEAGANVVVNYHRNEDAAREVVAQCEATGSQCIAVKGDVADEQSANNLIWAAAELGSPSILVNNAGVALDKLLTGTSLDDWNQVLQTNLTGPFLCTKAILPYLFRQQRGRIINVSSIWGISGGAGESAYSASKGGLIAWTKAIARELAAHRITVNAIAPGAIDTEMIGSLSPDDKATLLTEIPLGRLGTPEDIAHLAVFMASSHADYLTGQVVSVNGGILT